MSTQTHIHGSPFSIDAAMVHPYARIIPMALSTEGPSISRFEYNRTSLYGISPPSLCLCRVPLETPEKCSFRHRCKLFFYIEFHSKFSSITYWPRQAENQKVTAISLKFCFRFSCTTFSPKQTLALLPKIDCFFDKCTGATGRIGRSC